MARLGVAVPDRADADPGVSDRPGGALPRSVRHRIGPVVDVADAGGDPHPAADHHGLDAMRLDWLGAAVYVPFAVLCTVVHELGHVVGARLAGTPAKSLVLGSHGRIYSETPATPGGQLLLKGSGPFAALAFGSLLLVTAAAVTTPVGAAGVWAVGTAVANLLPLPPANSATAWPAGARSGRC